ncbi:MAG: 50S ribosomal protein L24 [Candidatus Woesearchaeota archaeon]
MKKKFSAHWKSSTQPRKQRKYRHHAPLHIKSKFVSVHLNADLRKKHGIRAIQARKGDKVKILRGQFKGREGKIDKVNISKTKIFVSKIESAKRDGSKAYYPLAPSNLMITELNTEDKKRIKTKPAQTQSKSKKVE